MGCFRIFNGLILFVVENAGDSECGGGGNQDGFPLDNIKSATGLSLLKSYFFTYQVLNKCIRNNSNNKFL